MFSTVCSSLQLQQYSFSEIAKTSCLPNLINPFQSVLQLIKDLLNALPNMFTHTRETHSALGPALQAAFKLMSPTGGRISVFQTQLPSLGAGILHSREDPNQRSSTKVQKLPLIRILLDWGLATSF